MQTEKKKLFLIDGNSFCYRAYYAIRDLSNSKGRATNAVYGVVTMITKLIKEQRPDLLAIAFDLKGPTFRHKKYKDYKIHRKPMPDDLVTQMPIIKEVVSAYRIPIFELQGYEADDVIATIARNAEKKKIATFIVTGDKDALQLVGPDIKVVNPQKDGLVYDEETVKERFGVMPSQITDLMAIMGDASDNIPGVMGIGEKGAKELIGEFKNIENMITHLDDIKSEAKRKLISANIEMARLSKELATVDINVPIEVDFDKLTLQAPDKKKLVEMFKELEFKSLLKEFMSSDGLKGEYSLIDSGDKLDELIGGIKRKGEFVFDFETTHVDPMIADPVGVSFSYESKEAYYVPFNLTRDLTCENVLKKMRPLFEGEEIKKIGQNIKYDYIMLKKNGVNARNLFFDTMIASYVLNPSKPNHNLGDISIEYLDHKMVPIEDLIGKGKNAITMDKVDVDKVMNYSCEDSDVTMRVKEVLEKELKEKGLEDLFFNVEMPLCEVLASMEMAGIMADEKYLKQLSEEMGKKLDELSKKIFELAGEEFNINSPKQLQVILFEKLKMPVIKKTKTGASTDEEVLSNLAMKYPLAEEILKYREYSKLKSTYVDALPDLINPVTGRIHTSFNQTVTATGRLSSSRPNLQNIPIKTEEGRKIRKAFIPADRKDVLLSADYSQIELRILAHLSDDDNLIRAFKEDRDIHRFTASLIYGAEEKDVTDQMRNSAKTVNFGIIYGMSPFGLSKDLGIGIEEAKEFIDNYFERYPGVKIYLEDKIREAKKRKYVTTIMQRRRYIPEINSDNVRIRNFAERTAINAPIQGSAADIIKVAMVNIHKKMQGLKSTMILQVHDELVFEVNKKEILDVIALVKEGMEHVVKLKVPIKVNLKSGENWLDLEEYKG